MPEIEDNDENENEEENEDNEEGNGVSFVTPFVTRPGKGKDKVHKNDTPIDNAGDIPLFEDADKRGLRTVSYIRVDKLNNPNAGFKGNIPTSSTLETISQLFGDGLYNLSACNARHQVLRTKENIRISLEANNPKALPSGGPSQSAESIAILREIIRNHDKEVERLEKSSGRTADESIQQSRQFIELIKTTTEASAQRDREHMHSVNKSQQDFFANMMIASGQMFQQTLAIITMGHQHLIETLRASKDDNKGRPSDVDTLLKGIMVAQSMGGNDDPDWIKALDKGGNMMRTLLQLKTGSIIPPAPAADEETEEPETTPGTPKAKKDPNKKPIFSKSEIREFIRLKQALNGRGIDLEEMVRQTREHLVDQSVKEKAEDSESSDTDSDENTEQPE